MAKAPLISQSVRVPPQNIEAEQWVLMACIVREEIIPQVERILNHSDFYRDSHRIIYETICELHTGVDFVTISQKLREKGQLERIGGEAYLLELIEPQRSAGWEYHAEIVKRMAKRRNLINLCLNIQDQAHDLTEDEETVLLNLKGGIRAIEEGEAAALDDKSLSNRTLYDRVWEDLWNDKSEPGLSLGIEAIEGRHYLERGCTHVVAAESGTGKSAFCLQVASHVAKTYGTTLYFSLESTRNKLAVRQIALKARVALTRLHKRNLNRADDQERISNAISELIKTPLILIDDTRYQEIERLCSFCETFTMNQRVQLIVVDFLQLLSTRDRQQNRHLEISYCMKRLCFLAKTVNCPVIVVSQLGKDLEKRGNRRPTLGDLKESGDIRTQADNILFLYAPDSEPVTYQVECFLGKGKDQEQFSEWLEFNGSFQEFSWGQKPEDYNPSRSHWREKE